MRYLLALVLAFGVTTAVWMSQPTDSTSDTSEQARAPVVRITELPLSVENVVDVSAPAAERNAVDSTPESLAAEADIVRFIPADHAKPTTSRPAASQRNVGALGGSFDVMPPTGFVDQVIALEQDTDRAMLEATIEELDGEVLRYLSNLHIASVRIPEENAELLDKLQGIRTAVPDSEITFMSKSSRDAARLPTTGMPEFVNVDTTIGVAVVDTGVDSHADINLAGRVTLSAPETVLDSNMRDDNALKALYLFDEGRGSRVFDRAAGSPSHLDHYADASNLMHPDSISLSNLSSQSSLGVEIDFRNKSDHAVEIFWVDYNGNKISQGIVQPNGSREIESQRKHPFIVANAATGRHEGLIYDLDNGEERVDFRGTPSAWSGDKLSVLNGNFVNYGATDNVGPACTSAGAVAFEAWVIPGNTTDETVIVERGWGDSADFMLRQWASRYQGRIRTSAGTTMVYTPWGSVVPGQLTHLLVTRTDAGVTQIYVNGQLADSNSQGQNGSINWSPSKPLRIGDPFPWHGTHWSGDLDLLAVHCRAFSSSDVSDHYSAGADAYVSVFDTVGHGTHVAGTIAGNASASGGEHQGIAPGA
ncbi:MAG: LamG-like jellyroll fold domain-containing protein, partial [Woeseiaceae bacterium]